MSAAAQVVSCPVCTRALPPDTWNLDYETYCPTCRAPVSALVFPALLRGHDGSAAGLAVEGTEATCFYHARKKAVVPCDRCGRFLCALCQVELSGENWCPSCIALHRKQGKLSGLDNRRTLYDNIALLLAVAPVATVVFWVFTVFTAPSTLFVVIRYWRAPSSLVPRTKVRFIIAGVVAVLQLAGWGILLSSVIFQLRRGVR